MKRRSPTARDLPHDVDDFADAGRRSVELFAGFGANVVMVNTDEMGWGGSLDDLHAVVAARDGGVEEGEGKKEKKHCAVLAKDIYLHPLQIAAAVDAGADGVLLMASVLGPRLEELLDACTVMGTEAVVEVHTPNECEHALELGAMALCLNNWDRVEGLWRANQAEAVQRAKAEVENEYKQRLKELTLEKEEQRQRAEAAEQKFDASMSKMADLKSSLESGSGAISGSGSASRVAVVVEEAEL